MDVINVILSAENLRTLVLLVAMAAGGVWLDRQQDKKMNGLGAKLRQEMDGLRQEMNALAAALRQEMDERFTAFHKLLKEVDFPQLAETIKTSVRAEMDERFTAFHKVLKENDFAHLHEAFKTMTFTMHKNGFLTAEDKKFIDSQLDK